MGIRAGGPRDSSVTASAAGHSIFARHGRQDHLAFVSSYDFKKMNNLLLLQNVNWLDYRELIHAGSDLKLPKSVKMTR